MHMDIFLSKIFSATNWVRILKFGTKLDSDELYFVAKTATYCFSLPLFVTDISAPIGASVFKFGQASDSMTALT